MNPPLYVAALDQGTTSTRCMLFDREGRMVSLAQREHHQHYPRAGWVEHDPMEIWDIVCRVLPEALADAGASVDQVVGLGITNQRETTVVWDRHTGRPVHHAIVWQDTRSSSVLPAVAADMPEEEIQARSGLPLVTYFSGPKVRWLLDSSPSLRERAERGDLLFGTMDSWLVWNLTGGPANGTSGGVHVTDVTNASRTMLMNLGTLDWDPELLAAMRVPRAMLPEIRPTVSSFGTTVAPIAGIALTAVIGDQQASLFGQAGFDRGDAKCTFGTGGFLLLNTGTSPVRSQHGLITTVAHAMEGEPAAYALEGSIAVAGSLVQWFRDSLGLIRSAAEIETQALTVADNGGCYVVPAFTGLYAPHWEPDARGVIVGLTSYVTKAHLCRAVLEATAWQTREVIDAMNADASAPLTRLAVDGGMTADNLLMQTIADFLDIPVVRPMVAETVSRGAAYAAGLGAEFARWRRAVELAIGWGT
ncbi:glycerol kinase GlpK [Nocardioides sp. NPDC047086]|uniref:glycerol kinase GlpK n=1 Tax=Nocardioides sp. NPDC047086 TaxID=3154810 RepID=UPI0033F0A554